MTAHHWDPPAPEAAELEAVLAATGARRDVALAPMTTLKVGGPAAGFAEPADPEALRVILATLAGHPTVPWTVVGKGSNLLVSDDGFPGLVLRLGEGFTAWSADGPLVTAGAAVPMPALAAHTARLGATGLEFAAGVPATVGGSVRMNAGAHGGEVAEHLVRITVTGAQGERELQRGEIDFSYRHSDIPRDVVVTSATWQLAADDPAAVARRVDEVKTWRREHQPIGERTCGSVFTNPPGASAGALIEGAGLKGHRIGTARISPMHANFIEADRGGRAADVAALIAHAQATVLERAGVALTPEVRLVGCFH